MNGCTYTQTSLFTNTDASSTRFCATQDTQRHTFNAVTASLLMHLLFFVSHCENLGSIVFSSGCVCVTGHVCTLSLVLLQRAGTAVCTRSVCMVCESVSRAESVRESDRRRKREEESCVCVWSRCWDLCVSLGRECRDPWTLLCFLLTRHTHSTPSHSRTHVRAASIRARMRVALRPVS